VDEKRKRIALSLKKLQPDPWTIVDDHYQMGQLVEGRVTRVLDFGAFVELDIGVEGLLHASEIIGTPELSPSDIVHSGEKLLVKIIRIDSQRKRLALSARQVRQGEWERWVADQQAEKEAQETKEVEKEVVAPEAEAEAAVEIPEETAAPEVEAETSEAVEAEAAAPEAEVEVVSETVEETAAPEAQVTVVETVEEAAAPEAETEAEISEVVEAETAAAETVAAEVNDEETATAVEPDASLAPDVTTEETEAA
jgi:small subunit ribosomal protein S1